MMGEDLRLGRYGNYRYGPGYTIGEEVGGWEIQEHIYISSFWFALIY